MKEFLQPPPLLAAQFLAWGVLLVIGGIVARKNVLYGLLTAAVAAPCVFITVAGGMVAAGIVIALPFSLFGSDLGESKTVSIIVFVLGHLIALACWIGWIKLTRSSPSERWGPGMSTDRKMGKRTSSYTKKPW